jgi:hypothetical protein
VTLRLRRSAGFQPRESCSARRSARVASSTAKRIVRLGMSISIVSPSRTSPIAPPSAASGETWPTERPEVPPEKRPSVSSAQALPSPFDFRHHRDDGLAEIAVLHAGGAPEPARAGHIAAMSGWCGSDRQAFELHRATNEKRRPRRHGVLIAAFRSRRKGKPYPRVRFEICLLPARIAPAPKLLQIDDRSP